MRDPQRERGQVATHAGAGSYSYPRIASIVRGACGALAKLALMATILAVVLSRVNPPAPAVRTPRTVPLVVGPETVSELSPPKTIVFDPETGLVDPLASRVGMDLYHASGSPWRDERGRSQMVGVLSGLPQGGSGEPALVRTSLPDGGLLDRLMMESLPAGRPCWFPDRSARILFVDSRSRLARLEFEARPNRRGELRPKTLRWRGEVAGSDGLLGGDVSWPSDPRLNGRILASVSPRSTRGGVARLEREQIWWLQLDQEHTEVVAAGRLTRPGVPDDGLATERCPVIGSDARGRLLLAYLERRTNEPRSHWKLKVVPVASDPESGGLSVLAPEARTLCGRCVATPPSFSPDNRWLRCLTWPEGSGSWRVQSFAINTATPVPPRSPDGSAAQASAESVDFYY